MRKGWMYVEVALPSTNGFIIAGCSGIGEEGLVRASGCRSNQRERQTSGVHQVYHRGSKEALPAAGVTACGCTQCEVKSSCQ